jgi:alkylhydroperoxidase family enzyme
MEPQPSGAHHDEVRRQFGGKELVALTTLFAVINVWNRLTISLRCEHQMGVPA